MSKRNSFDQERPINNSKVQETQNPTEEQSNNEGHRLREEVAYFVDTMQENILQEENDIEEVEKNIVAESNKESYQNQGSDTMGSTIEKWKNYLFLDDEHKSSQERKMTGVLIFVSVGLFAILLFVISYWVALSNAQDIKDLQHARSRHIEDMININVNTYSPDYLVSKEKVQQYINSIESLPVDKKAFDRFIDTFNEYKISNIKNLLESDKNFNFQNYLEKISNNFKQELSGLVTEKAILINTLEKLEVEYQHNIKPKLNFKDSVSANLAKEIRYIIRLDKNKNNFNSILLFGLNIIKNHNLYDMAKIKELDSLNKMSPKTDSLKKIYSKIDDSTFAYILTDYTNAIFLDNNNTTLYPFHEFYKSILSDIDSHNIKKAKLIKDIAEKNDLIDAKKNSQLSLDKYKQNKTYLFQKQFLINNEMIQFSINKGIGYLAFYNALIIVILTFTAILTLCIFGISTKGWGSANDQLKILTIIVLVVLGVSNLILVTLKPKDNYMAYIKSADKNENIQMDIINFFNNYEKLNEIQIDSMLKRNLQQMTRFNEILPETDDSKLIQEFDKMNPSNVK